jgi:AcrR family transcriptional regulator
VALIRRRMMTNLREKKKEQTKKKIQAISLQLFETLGYEKATMDKIATEAEIGLGTLYNYFPSKTALFFSIIERNIETFISELEEIINSETTLLESLREFFNTYLKSFTTYGKNIWRDMLREIIFGEHMGYSKIKEIDQNFINQLYKLLCARIVEIKVNKDEKLSTASKALYSLLEYHIIYFVSDISVSLHEMTDSLMEQTNLFVEGLISLENI